MKPGTPTPPYVTSSNMSTVNGGKPLTSPGTWGATTSYYLFLNIITVLLFIRVRHVFPFSATFHVPQITKSPRSSCAAINRQTLELPIPNLPGKGSIKTVIGLVRAAQLASALWFSCALGTAGLLADLAGWLAVTSRHKAGRCRDTEIPSRRPPSSRPQCQLLFLSPLALKRPPPWPCCKHDWKVRRKRP
ncbi:hypothetical protein BJ166DRAFT_3383 [Pestalotiopsis sp. NC0098]|nr:hypothetical protein BJ166DRAFT_3383 [Pestalotiopsis sp. NC0098]